MKNLFGSFHGAATVEGVCGGCGWTGPCVPVPTETNPTLKLCRFCWSTPAGNAAVASTSTQYSDTMLVIRTLNYGFNALFAALEAVAAALKERRG